MKIGTKPEDVSQSNNSTSSKPINNTSTNKPQTPSSNPPINTIQLLDGAPDVMRRPLLIIKGRAYAATWPYVQIKTTQQVKKNGKLIKIPHTIQKRLLTIISEDGAVFHDEQPEWSQLGFTVELSEIPEAKKLWSEQGIRRYQNKERVDAKVLFEQICNVIDTFIDFDKSIAEQRTMCEFIGCYIFATWFLDAFNVIGFLWPNGERGSGKTQLLNLVTSLGFLGHLLLASSTFASLRDLADYGATLGFDDAENLDSKKFDADKRAILLAGNRKGSTVTLKESIGNSKWKTRYVNTYCPRVFSAINLPDPVLASRSIVIPLVRTLDKTKANIDPLEFKKWPYDYRKLIDDLWALALANLTSLSSYEEMVNEKSSLKGRDLEPFRPSLAVALWLDENGVNGLWERMNNLSHEYQKEKGEFETDDVTALIIRSLMRCVEREVVKLGDVSEGQKGGTKHFIPTYVIEAEVGCLVDDDEMDINGDDITSRKIGRKLSQMRFKKHREGGTGRSGYKVSRDEVMQSARSLGLIDESTPVETSQTSHDLTTSQE